MKLFLLSLLISVNLFGQSDSPIELSKIEDSVWVHTTYKLYDNQNIPSNGLIVQTSSGLVLIDTPWDDSLTIELLDSTKKQFNQDIVLAIITHAHNDRIGGISTLHKKGIKVVSNALTCQKAKELGFEIPEQVKSDTTFVVGKECIELFYPGAGHTIDNSVVCIPERKILFGGCMIKAESNVSLDNVTDADLKEWSRSIHALQEIFPTVEVVIPGHGTWGGLNLLQHTLDLLIKR